MNIFPRPSREVVGQVAIPSYRILKQWIQMVTDSALFVASVPPSAVGDAKKKGPGNRFFGGRPAL
jgi:hypothetical protein